MTDTELDSSTSRAHALARRALPPAKGTALVLLLPLVLNLVLARQPPLGIYVNGAIIGSLYALVAIALILVYQATRIINFAAAGLGSAGAVLALMLIVRRGVPYGLAVLVLIAVAGAVGAATDVTVIRRFERAPRLILTVATIGVAQLLAFIEFWIPKWVSGDTLPPNDFPTPADGITFRLGGVVFSGDHVVAIVVVAILVGALTAVFRFTDTGIAIRAAAENADRASLLGIPVRRVSTIVWTLAAVLSAVGVFLRAPLVGLPVGGLIGPSLLLFGLVPAVVARMRSFGTAFVVAVALGMTDQALLFSTRQTSVIYGVLLVVLLVALYVQRGDLARAHHTGQATWQAVADIRPIPHELRHLPEVRRVRLALRAAAVVIAVGAPFVLGPDRLGFAALVVIYAMVGVSFVVLSGWAGQISLGQFGIAGVGAAVCGSLAAHHTADFFVCLLAAGLSGALAALVIGVPALRIQGLFLAATTLAFAFVVEALVLNPRYMSGVLPGGDGHYIERPVLYGIFDLGSDRAFYYVTLVVFALVVGVAASLRRYRSGRVLIAARDNARTAQALGLNLARTKLVAFAIAGFVAGLAGGLLAFQQEAVDSLTFTPVVSINLFAMAVIGGLGSVLGAVLGALYVQGIPYFLEEQVRGIGVLATGVGLMVLLSFLQGGLAEAVYRGRDHLLRRLALKHGIHVPSLVADSLVVDDAAAATHANGNGPTAVVAPAMAAVGAGAVGVDAGGVMAVPKLPRSGNGAGARSRKRSGR